MFSGDFDIFLKLSNAIRSGLADIEHQNHSTLTVNQTVSSLYIDDYNSSILKIQLRI